MLISLGRNWLVMASFSLVPFVVIAEESWDFSEPHKTRYSDGTQLTMNLCLARERDMVDARLKELNKELQKSLVDPLQAKEAASAWRSSRDRACKYSLSGLEPQGSDSIEASTSHISEGGQKISTGQFATQLR